MSGDCGPIRVHAGSGLETRRGHMENVAQQGALCCPRGATAGHGVVVARHGEAFLETLSSPVARRLGAWRLALVGCRLSAVNCPKRVDADPEFSTVSSTRATPHICNRNWHHYNSNP